MLIWLVKDDYCTNYTCQEVEQAGGYEEAYKCSQISLAHTIVEQSAVVIEADHTVVTRGTMRGFWQSFDFACWAVSIVVDATLSINLSFVNFYCAICLGLQLSTLLNVQCFFLIFIQ